RLPQRECLRNRYLAKNILTRFRFRYKPNSQQKRAANSKTRCPSPLTRKYELRIFPVEYQPQRESPINTCFSQIGEKHVSSSKCVQAQSRPAECNHRR